MHVKLDLLKEKGYVVLKDDDGPAIPKEEWMELEYMDWKSGGDTNFAPIASAYGEMECHGFWDHGKPDKDGMWTTNAEKCPNLVAWTKKVGANFGRVRIIKLNPNTEAEATHNMPSMTTTASILMAKGGLYVCGWNSPTIPTRTCCCARIRMILRPNRVSPCRKIASSSSTHSAYGTPPGIQGQSHATL